MSLINRGVETNAGALGRLPLIEPAGRRNEPAQPIFGIDAKVNGRAARHGAFVKSGQGVGLIAFELGLDRQSGVEGKSVDLGGRRTIKKKKTQKKYTKKQIEDEHGLEIRHST